VTGKFDAALYITLWSDSCEGRHRASTTAQVKLAPDRYAAQHPTIRARSQRRLGAELPRRGM
jgi:hypothetical protein